MGLTIHYYGTLKTREDFQEVMNKAIAFAEKHNFPMTRMRLCGLEQIRMKNDKVFEFWGQVSGVQIQPHEKSDPLILTFDNELYIHQFCKTQFAGVATHIKVVELLRHIEKHFQNLTVYDEGEFWQTGDIQRLEQKFEDCAFAIKLMSNSNPDLKGPMRIDGRMIDLS